MLACLTVCSVACEKPAEKPTVFRVHPALDLTTQPAIAGSRCIVHLHGKGDRGAATVSTAGITHLHPDGNHEAWGGLEWRYFPEPGYEDVRAVVAETIASKQCERVIVHGFSNGASLAAKLFCRGETFGKRVIGYVIDDPVPDRAVEKCQAAQGVKLALYSTGTLAHAVENWDCTKADYTCEGGKTIGIGRYARALGTSVKASANKEHAVYQSPPEYASWW